jgi:hypothetical protein
VIKFILGIYFFMDLFFYGFLNNILDKLINIDLFSIFFHFYPNMANKKIEILANILT